MLETVDLSLSLEREGIQGIVAEIPGSGTQSGLPGIRTTAARDHGL